MKLLLASPIDPPTVETLEREYDVQRAEGAEPARLREAIADRTAVVLRSGVQLSADVLSHATELRLVIRAGAGLDNVDVDFARQQGIRVVRIPGMSAQPVAEFTFALLLSLARKVSLADRHMRRGEWPKPDLGGTLLMGKTLGIVGAGNIGGRVGELGAAWDMQVLGSVGHPDPQVADDLRTRGITLADTHDVVAKADFLCLHVPLDASTRYLIDEAALSRMRPGSLLVNVARGGVVNEQALYDRLLAGDTLAGAALDVHEHEGDGTVSRFAALPNVVLTPHIGAMALDSQRLIGDRVTELIQAFQQGRLDEEVRDGEHVA